MLLVNKKQSGAFEEARDIATQVMRNEAVLTGGHTTRTQIFDLTITYDTVAYTPTNASYIIKR